MPLLSLVAAAASSGLGVGDLAALMGGLAAVISAVTGLVVALRRREEPQIVVVTPDQAAELDLPVGAVRPRRKRGES